MLQILFTLSSRIERRLSTNHSVRVILGTAVGDVRITAVSFCLKKNC